eukprot:Hpha_TRINITY_DN16333_c0_g1::TRINITY_DN16333_c0_g1_i1::g.61994::m.61994
MQDPKQELQEAAVVNHLFEQTVQTQTNVLFLHPQIAFAGLLHTYNPVTQGFEYAHLPGLRHVLQLALREADGRGKEQSVVCMGDWSTTLVQAILAAINDLPNMSPDAVAQLESALHLVMLLSCAGGRFSACGMNLWLGGSSCGLEVGWLWPGFLSTLWLNGEREAVLRLPIYQHFLAAPRSVVEKLLPGSVLSLTSPNPAMWRELVALLQSADHTPSSTSSLEFGEELGAGAEAFLRGLALVLTLLDRPQDERRSAAHDTVLGRLCRRQPTEVRAHLQKTRKAHGEQASRFIADRVFLLCVDWAARAGSTSPPRPVQLWPLPKPNENVSLTRPPPAKAGVRVLLLPQAVPSFVSPSLPACLGPYVFLGNLAAEHLSVFAAKTLPGNRDTHLSEQVVDACHGDECSSLLTAVLRADKATLRKLEAPLSFSHAPDGQPVLTVEHTHRRVHYPLCAVPHAHLAASAFISSLASLLKPVLSSAPVFLQHLPLHAAGSPLRLHEPLVAETHAQVRGSVLLAAARELYAQRKRVGAQQHQGTVLRRKGADQRRGDHHSQARRHSATPDSSQVRSVSFCSETQEVPPQQESHQCSQHPDTVLAQQLAAQVAELKAQQESLQQRLEPIETRMRTLPSSSHSGSGHSTRSQSPVSAAPSVPPETEDPFSARLSDVVQLTKSFRLRREAAMRPPSRGPTMAEPVPQGGATRHPHLNGSSMNDPHPHRRRTADLPPTPRSAPVPAATPAPRPSAIATGRPPLAPLPQQQQQHPAKRAAVRFCDPKQPSPTPQKPVPPAFSERQWQAMLQQFDD